MTTYPEEPYPDDIDTQNIGNEDVDEYLAQGGTAAAASGEENWDTDWSPEGNLMPLGWRRMILSKVELTKTRAGDPAVTWAFQDQETGRTLQRKINLVNGKGIERINVQYCNALGLEVPISPSGRYQIPGGLLQSKIGSAVDVKIKHRPHWEEGRKQEMIEEIEALRAPQSGTMLPDY